MTHAKLRLKLIAAAAVLMLTIAAAGVAGVTAFAAESKISLAIESYSGEWQADPNNPSLTRPQNAIDGNAGTSWYCQWGCADNRYGDLPNMILSFGGVKTVCRVEVTVSTDFIPQDILIELGSDGAWAEAGRFSGIEASEKVICHVPNQCADKLRVTVMEKSAPDNNGFSLCKIAEIEAYATTAEAVNGLALYTDVTAGGTVICSSDAQNADALADGLLSESGGNNGTVTTKYYTDYATDYSECDAVIGYSFARAKEIGKISLYAASKQNVIYGFPRDFAVVFSPDGNSWYVVPHQAYFGYTPTGGENAFAFDNKISAKAIGIKVLDKSRALNGGYSVSLAEMRVYSSPLSGDAYVPEPNDIADSSVITLTPIPNINISESDSADIDLSEHFACDAGELTYSLSGAGEIKNGRYTASADKLGAGRYTVTVTARLNDFCMKQANFTLTVQSDLKMYVTAVSDSVTRSAYAAREFDVNLVELFRYSGAESLVFAASYGTINGSTLTLRYETSGNYTVNVECYPVSDRSMGASVNLNLTVNKGGINLSPLTVESSEYANPLGVFVICGCVAGGLSVAGLITLVILLKRRKTV